MAQAAFITDPVVGQPGDIHDAAKNPLGMIAKGIDASGYFAEYVYLKGIGSTVLGSWVFYDEIGISTLTVANSLGAVAVATGATVASTWGWYQITGRVSALCLASYADNAKVWVTSTPGSVDDADVAVDFVTNAIGRSARDTTTGLAVFQINRPFCHNEVLN